MDYKNLSTIATSSKMKGNFFQLNMIFRKETKCDIAREIFAKADINGSDNLSKSETLQIMKDLQLHISKTEFERVYAKYDKDGNKNLDKSEFQNLIVELFRKEELVSLFAKYAKGFQAQQFEIPSMTVNELKEFYAKEQFEVPDISNLNLPKEVINQTNPDLKCISFDDFNAVIYSAKNVGFKKNHESVYQVLMPSQF
jgi:hypothetical protein